jgi:cytochrome P450
MMTALLDIFFAGTDTVANTLHWALLLLSVNPHIQDAFYEEIDRVIGCSRLPEASDEDNMIYTQALIQEILRYTSIAPMAVFHSAIQDVRFHGFKIPKDAMVLLNFHGAHHDKGYWGDPEVIRPSRFLSPDGQALIKHEAFFPFGGGKRLCVGEALARKEMFLFLTSIIQKFRVGVDPNIVNPSLEPIVSFILLPPNHGLVFEKRM